MARGIVTIFGGSGFLGRHLVKRLAADDWVVRVAVRHPAQADFLQVMGNPGQIVALPADVTHETSIALALKGADAAINLVGILYERGKRTFQAIHAEGAERVARIAAAEGVKSLGHVSALGASSDGPSDYARTKAAGEAAVHRAFPNATIFRPSVIFGPEDDFFNRFARMSHWSPFLPYFLGNPKFQPVYVGDVAQAIANAVADPAQYGGKIYELCGPERLTMSEIMAFILKQTGRKRFLLPMPYWVGDLEAKLLQYLPTPLLTPDQMRQLRCDNVCSGTHLGFESLGIRPTTVQAIVPGYLR